MALNKYPTKRVIITNTTQLHELGGISGPIYHPTSIPINKIRELIRNGINVYEVDPNDSKNKIKLDLKNFDKVNFKKPTKIANISNKTVRQFMDDKKKENNDKKKFKENINIVEKPKEEHKEESDFQKN